MACCAAACVGGADFIVHKVRYRCLGSIGSLYMFKFVPLFFLGKCAEMLIFAFVIGYNKSQLLLIWLTKSDSLFFVEICSNAEMDVVSM